MVVIGCRNSYILVRALLFSEKEKGISVEVLTDALEGVKFGASEAILPEECELKVQRMILYVLKKLLLLWIAR